MAAPSGVGYAYPSIWPADSRRGDFAGLTHDGMQAAGMSVVNVLGQNDDEPSESELLDLLAGNVTGMLYYSWGSGYSGFGGKMWTMGGKPVVSGRYTLWGEEAEGPMLGVDGMIAALTALPCRDKSMAEAYSVVPVHAWSHNLTDVMRVVAALEEAGGFEVVLPSELLIRVASNVMNLTGL